jgi:hypothetical protein
MSPPVRQAISLQVMGAAAILVGLRHPDAARGLFDDHLRGGLKVALRPRGVQCPLARYPGNIGSEEQGQQ